MTDIRNCYLPEIPVDFDVSTLVVPHQQHLKFRTAARRANLAGIILVVCIAVGATMYINYIQKKIVDERIK